MKEERYKRRTAGNDSGCQSGKITQGEKKPQGKSSEFDNVKSAIIGVSVLLFAILCTLVAKVIMN